MRVNVKMDRKIADVSEGMDVDVSVPECVFHITAADVKDISVLLFAYDILKKDGAHVNADVCTLYLIHSLSYVCMFGVNSSILTPYTRTSIFLILAGTTQYLYFTAEI